MPLTPRTQLDGFEILGPLGAGGMGEVYRAREPGLKREVAIKVLPAYFSRNSDRLRRFEQEAQAAAALNHPNILAIHRGPVDPVRITSCDSSADKHARWHHSAAQLQQMVRIVLGNFT